MFQVETDRPSLVQPSDMQKANNKNKAYNLDLSNELYGKDTSEPNEYTSSTK